MDPIRYIQSRSSRLVLENPYQYYPLIHIHISGYVSFSLEFLIGPTHNPLHLPLLTYFSVLKLELVGRVAMAFAEHVDIKCTEEKIKRINN